MGAKKVKLPKIACALDINPRPGLSVKANGIVWSDKAKYILQKLRQELNQNNSDKYLTLPYGSLRLGLQAYLPNASYIDSGLGYPWHKPKPGVRSDPFLYTSEQEAVESAANALRKWIELEFFRWAERYHLSSSYIEELYKVSDEAFVRDCNSNGIDISEIPSAEDHALWKIWSNAVLQHVARRLEGQELFETLPPVLRVARGEAANFCELMTRPQVGWDQQLFSMLATISIETQPYRQRPILRVSAGRRLWLDGPPTSHWSDRKKVGGFILRDGSSLAVHFRAERERKSGKLIAPASPAFMRQVLDVISSKEDWFEDAVRQGLSGDPFIGLVYHSGSDGRRAPKGTGTGATPRDNYDLWQQVREILSEDGFTTLDCEEVTVTVRRGKDHTSVVPKISLVKLMQELELAKPDKAEAGSKLMKDIQDENRKRMQCAFGDTKPALTVYAREDELERLANAINLLLGDTVIIRLRVLPQGVHGDKNSLPASDKGDRERYAERVKAWIKDIHETQEPLGTHVLVQAAQRYQTGNGKKVSDDKVNKEAGRHALAVYGNANVQYLLPPDDKDEENWIHRVQAAVYDLLFGHSALVSETKSIVRKAFSRATPLRGATKYLKEMYPGSIVGISVAERELPKVDGRSQGRGMLFTATRVDTETGRSSARIGWCKNHKLQISPEWKPFHETLRQVASLDVSGWSEKKSSADRFQAFVRYIIRNACLHDNRPLVLIDASNTTGLWPWLQDQNIGEDIEIGYGSIGSEWKGARIVRIRHGKAPRIIQPQFEVDENGQLVPRHTIGKTVLKLSSGPNGSHFLISPSYLMQEKRGQSVYRPSPWSNQPFASNYRLPGVIEATVAHVQDGDDPEKIANLIAQLKDGYAHTKDTTALPQPLFFAAKVKDYMCPFSTEKFAPAPPEGKA